ncbi:MAG: Gfo/Idh/MocA family oxidoreductase [Pseudomonadota bacterium]|nr:Gfo/Idh/MocA family oxidoreductase [Pseudomonadota bacterium]
MISTLLVGFGFSAQTFHLPFLSYLSDFSIDGVVSSRPSEVKHVLPLAKVYSSLEEALETNNQAHPAFDLVIITTPNHLHAPQAELALNHGCNVLVEKPFTLNADEASALVNLAKEKQKHLCVYHNRRFDGDFITLQSLIKDGALGEIKRFESRFDRFRPIPRDRWRENAGPGSGIFWDLGPHLIDQALQLFGNPLSVSSDIYTLRDQGQSDDAFDITLYYADKVVKLGSSAFQGGQTLRFDIQGTKASYRKFYLDPQEDQLRQGKEINSSDWANTPSAQHGVLANGESSSVITTKHGKYLAFYEKLASAIQNDTPLPVSAESVVPVIQIIEMAIEANKQQQRLMLI